MDRDQLVETVPARILEDEQAEPFSEYYNYEPGTIVMLDGTWRVPAELLYGTLIVGISPTSNGRSEPALRGAVVSVIDRSGAVIFELDQGLAKQYPIHFTAPWVRLEAPFVSGTAAPIYVGLRDALTRQNSRTAEPETLSVNGGVIRMRAGLFEEEHRPRNTGGDRFGDGWVFAVAFERNAPAPEVRPGKRRPRPSGKKARLPPVYFLARPGRAGPTDMAARVPELHRLPRKCVALFGVGCLGAPSGLELARAGLGELRLLDDDFIDPAASVRWPLGVGTAGLYKVKVLARLIEEHYPYTKVTTEVLRLGAAEYVSPEDIRRGNIPKDQQDVVDRMLDGAHLVYDATAEEGIQYFLADRARERGLPYISVQGTQGGWGGVVVWLRPEEMAGCWICYRLQCMTDIAPPPALDTGRVQPTGCGNPTFTGANFDLGNVTLMGVRMAVATLSEGISDSEIPGYPSADWDVAVLALRDPSGRLIPPTWRTYTVARHPSCPVCNRS